MDLQPAPPRYRAVSMQLAAYLDERCVEMRIVTDTGQPIVIVCDKDGIFAIERHIDQIRRECPAISTWTIVPSDNRPHEEGQSNIFTLTSEYQG